jgi:hypothetical protein
MAPLPPLLAGVLYVTVLLTATFGYAIFLLAPSLPLLFTVPPFRITCMRWYHAWSGLIGVHYFGLAATGLELLLGVQVRIYGDELPKGERALILSNHRQAVQLTQCCMRITAFINRCSILLQSAGEFITCTVLTQAVLFIMHCALQDACRLDVPVVFVHAHRAAVEAEDSAERQLEEHPWLWLGHADVTVHLLDEGPQQGAECAF